MFGSETGGWHLYAVVVWLWDRRGLESESQFSCALNIQSWYSVYPSSTLHAIPHWAGWSTNTHPYQTDILSISPQLWQINYPWASRTCQILVATHWWPWQHFSKCSTWMCVSEAAWKRTSPLALWLLQVALVLYHEMVTVEMWLLSRSFLRGWQLCCKPSEIW